MSDTEGTMDEEAMDSERKEYQKNPKRVKKAQLEDRRKRKTLKFQQWDYICKIGLGEGPFSERSERMPRE